jgi:hypothetical protein
MRIILLILLFVFTFTYKIEKRNYDNFPDIKTSTRFKAASLNGQDI